MKAEKLAEAQKKALQDAAERAAKEAAEKEAAKTRQKAATEVAQKGAMEQKWTTSAETTREVRAGNLISKDECSIVPKNVQLPGISVFFCILYLYIEILAHLIAKAQLHSKGRSEMNHAPARVQDE